MKTIGLITIGQTPRGDVLEDLLPIFGPSLRLLQAGALDGLTAEDIAEFAPGPEDEVLISKLRDGTAVVFAERHILPRLQQCVRQLETDGTELILFLCTGHFPEFQSDVPLVFPCRLLNQLVPVLSRRQRIAVIAPVPEQEKQCAEKWGKLVPHVQVLSASPYGDPNELERAARAVEAMDVDLVVLDCIGYTSEMKRSVREISGKPVVLGRTLAARVVMELLD